MKCSPCPARHGLFLIVCFLTCASICHAADVSFYAVLKGEKYNQTSPGAPLLGGGNPYRLGAIVAPTTSGSVLNATVSPPGGSPQTLTFDPPEGWFDISTLKYPTLSALDTANPVGAYTFNIGTLHDGQKTPALNLPAETFPTAPHLGNFAAYQAIIPNVDFTLKWDPFVGGTASDLIFVLGGDPVTGAINFHSVEPFQPGALNGTSTSVVIPGALLPPNTPYFVEIHFVKVVSTNGTAYPGATGLVGFESFTDAQLMTTAAPTLGTFDLSFRQFAQGGSFLNSNSVAAPLFPVSINGYRAELIVSGTTNYASPDLVFFTGPPGSGLTNTVVGTSGFAESTTNAMFYSPKVNQPAIAPSGTWLVNYGGAALTFPEANAQIASHLVVPVPNISLSNDNLVGVNWTYHDPSGNELAAAPTFLSGIHVQTIDPAGSVSYDSGLLSPAQLSHSFTNTVTWTNVITLRFLYWDTLTNSYVIGFPKVTATAPIVLDPVSFSVASGFAFRLTAQVGHGYLVQFSPDLAHWTNLVTTNLTAATVEILDPQAGKSDQRFYRANLVD